MSDEWEQSGHDPVSGRRIFERSLPVKKSGHYGTYDFKIAKEFEVRTADGTVLLHTSGSASGEYWCGVFLFFVEGTDGKKVRLQESDREDEEFIDVPDRPIETIPK